jgi:chromosome segregation ATPase
MECTKAKYCSEEFANNDIERINRRSTKQIKPVRAYLCECGYWHITSNTDARHIKIQELEQQLKQVQEENQTLKSRERKEKQEDETLEKMKQTISKLRKDISDLVTQKIQLENKLKEINEKQPPPNTN